jgi:tetratricopeptide (TPR) repeat protein
MNCPKCGRKTSNLEKICSWCDYILDTSWIDEKFKKETTRVVRAADTMAVTSMSQSIFGEDALIVGQARNGFSRIEAKDTGLIPQEATRADIYVGKDLLLLLEADAIPAQVESPPDAAVNLSPYESHVLQWVNGHRPIASIQRKSGLPDDSFQTAVTLLADKGFIVRCGIVDLERLARARARRKKRLNQKEGNRENSQAERTQIKAMQSMDMDAPLTDRHPAALQDGTASEPWGQEQPSEDISERDLPEALASLLEAPNDTSETRPPNALSPALRKRPRLPQSFKTGSILGSDSQEEEQTAKAPSQGASKATDEHDSIYEEKTLIKSNPLTAEESFDEAGSSDPSDALPDSDAAPIRETKNAKEEGIDFASDSSRPQEGESAVQVGDVNPEPTAPEPHFDFQSVKTDGTGNENVLEPEADAPVSVAPEDFNVESYARSLKAQKIFEQAQKDFDNKRFSSAAMNAKLAAIYDPENEMYASAYENWSALKPQREADPEQRQDVRLYRNARRAEAKGDYEQAAKFLHKALAITPTAAPLHNQLGVILAVHLNEISLAADHLLQACELEPANFAFKNNLGKILGMQEDVRLKKKQSWRFFDDDSDNVVKVRKIRPKMF